jgi:TonB-dependent starch-binding outer membrane protein SusC
MKQLHCLLVFFLLTSVIAIAQKKTITGKVTNQATGEVLQGVNILADKQKGGTTTKPDGTYSITVDKNTATLIFSYVGFTPQTIIIADKTTIDVLLVAVPTDMNEVVVIGYGTTKKSHLTGAISKFKNDKLDESPVPRLDQALQGKIAGVQVQNQTSEAGADPKIRVRGLSSVNAGASPLVVVDGHPVPDGLSYVNPADVESVEVLKDAASAAIYGSRGASGVIIITTKSGKADKPKYNVKFSNGSKTVYERYPMMTTTEYTNMLYYEAALKSKDPSITPPTGTQIIANNEKAAYIVENYIVGGPTDWQDQALRSATVRNLQLNVSGGNRNLKYFISGAYQRDQGMMYHSEYDRYMLRTRLDAQLSKRVKFSFNLNPSYNKRERPSVGYIDFVRFQSFLPVYHTAATIAFVTQNPAWANLRVGDFVQARHFNARPYSGLMPDGSLYNSGATLLDPFNTANNTPKSVMETRFINSNEYRLQSSGDLTVNILPGLDFKALGSIYINYGKTVDFARRSSNRDGDANRGQYNDRTLIDLLSENTLTYAKTYKKHSLNVLGGFTAQKSRVTDEQIIGLNFPSDNIQTANNAGTIEQPSIDANGNLQGSYTLKNHEGLVSWLGRVMYSYDNKYLFSASLRTDGSSKFAPGKKWGAFPSVSVGWALSEEKFLDNASGWLDNLKLRASYGVSGNNRILDFAWLDLLYLANYPLGGANVVVQGLGPSTTILANPDITWERTFQYNGGLDMAMFKNAVTFSIDIYQSKTDQLLLKQSAMGFTGVPQTWNNIGNLQNRGIEFEITSNNIRRKNFKWTTSANISHNKNKLLEYGEEKFVLNQGERTELYLNEVGSPFIQFYGYKTDGVWLSQAQITAAQGAGLTSSLSNVFVPGGLKLVDLNGDNKLDAADRTVIGNPYPDFIWGITNTVTYKAFDLSFMFQGSQGGELINGDPNYNETKRYNRNYNTNRWLSPMFPGDGKTPYSTIGFNWMLTDYVVEDASYYCLREVIVGYTLPDKIAKTLHLNSLRAYFSGQNLYFHTPKSYRGINTEARFTSGPYNTPAVDGYQRGGFPMPRTIIFGLDINF